MARMAISPNFFVDPNEGENIMKEQLMYAHYDKTKLETKIMVYEDRVNGWFLDIAELLKENPHSGFVILMICISQLEGIEQFRNGKKTTFSDSKEVLKNALRRIFTITSQYEEALDIIVNDVRHGLFHDGMTRKKIYLDSSIPSPISLLSNKTIYINPHLFLNELRNDFKKYIAFLIDPLNTDLRNNFEKIWDETYSI